jgi:phage tail-like protein
MKKSTAPLASTFSLAIALTFALSATSARTAHAAPLQLPPGAVKIVAEKIRFSASDNDGITHFRRQQNMMAIQKFSFEIDGVIVAGVHTIDGLENESDIVEYKDGEAGVSHTRPGKLVITRDWSPKNSDWQGWFENAQAGKVERRSISVIFHNDAGEESMRINLFHCWPSKWNGPALNARSSAHAVEKLEIVTESYRIVDHSKASDASAGGGAKGN